MSSEQDVTTRKLVSQLLGEDPEFRDVVGEFVEGLTKRLDDMKKAYEKTDWESLTTFAHRLKGAGGSYGYPEISEVGAKMEHSFRAHDAGEFSAWINELNELVAAAMAGLSEEKPA